MWHFLDFQEVKRASYELGFTPTCQLRNPRKENQRKLRFSQWGWFGYAAMDYLPSDSFWNSFDKRSGLDFVSFLKEETEEGSSDWFQRKVIDWKAFQYVETSVSMLFMCYCPWSFYFYLFLMWNWGKKKKGVFKVLVFPETQRNWTQVSKWLC